MSLFKIMDNFLKMCLERMKEFQAGLLVFFITSLAYATIKVTTSGQICEILVYTAYCNTYCKMGQLYCIILQYTFYCIVSVLRGTPLSLILRHMERQQISRCRINKGYCSITFPLFGSGLNH